MARTFPRCGIIDLITFLIIAITAGRSKTKDFPGLPNILKAILRDATVYFLLMVIAQLVLFFFLFLAPVGDPHRILDRLILLYSSFVNVQTQIQLMPGL